MLYTQLSVLSISTPLLPYVIKEGDSVQEVKSPPKEKSHGIFQFVGFDPVIVSAVSADIREKNERSCLFRYVNVSQRLDEGVDRTGTWDMLTSPPVEC